MEQAAREFWPFAMPPSELQSQEDRAIAVFMATAFDEGFQPCRFLPRDFGAESPTGRNSYITHRGRAVKDGPVQWELWFGTGPERIVGLWVDSFQLGATLALLWLRGSGLQTLLGEAEGHILKGPLVAPNPNTSDQL